MAWQDLLAEDNSTVTAPWLGGRTIYANGRTFRIKGNLPREFGWYSFNQSGPRNVTLNEVAEPEMFWEDDHEKVVGYLIGDRLVPDNAGFEIDPADIYRHGVKVYLIEPGLDMFTRALVVFYEKNKYIYVRPEFPLGPEPLVLNAYDDRAESISDIPEVVPSLDLSFRHEVWRREQIEERRRELERIRLEEERARAEQERRERIMRQVGTGEGRRELARVDFAAACRASLAQSGAEYLGHNATRNSNETAVRYRFRNQRLECVINNETLRVVDAGICLSAGGVRGDRFFTLESLPVVVGEAIDRGLLHVYRYA